MKHAAKSCRIVIVASLALASPPQAPVQAPQQAPPQTEIDRIFSWATQECPGCSVAVALNGKTIVSSAYGSADLESKTAISPDTIFDAGSLTKQFVAAAALVLVEDGKLSLTEDIHAYVPELPEYKHKITIDHLLTHTSGIRDWTGMMPLTARDDDALTMILRQRGLNFTPGEEWGYSNSGFVLMKEIIARVSGMSFNDFARTRLFEPLGMKSTSHCSDIQGVAGPRALAYEKAGNEWRQAMMLGKDRGGGAVFSTASDLIIWNDALTNNRLGALVSAKLQEPATLSNGRKLDYAHGLILSTYRGTKEIWHTGSADGYKSYLGRFPEHGISIAIMCNSGDGTDRTGFAHSIFDLIVPRDGGAAAKDDQPAEGEGPPPMPPAGVDLSNRTGLFVHEQTGEMLQLRVDSGRFRIAGGPGLVMMSESRFRRWGASSQFMSADAFELNFLSADEFELKSMEGRITKYRRAEAFAPTQEELKAFAGRFESDEIGTVLAIEPSESGAGLTMRLEHAPEKMLELKPVDRDTFQFSRMTVRFVRDEAGNVSGFDYSNPLLRNVRFMRLSTSK